MAYPVYSRGDVLLASLIFTGGQGSKRRPVLVVYDFGDADLLVLPVTSHSARVSAEVVLVEWRAAGLKLPSTVRLEKLATIEKTCVARKLGAFATKRSCKAERTFDHSLQRNLSLVAQKSGQ